MKTMLSQKYLRTLLQLAWVASLIFILSCSKDGEDTPPEISEPINGHLVESEGIAAEDLGEEQGSIGILIDIRNVVRKGYMPTVAEIDVDAQEGDYSTSLAIDEFTNMARLAIPVADLSGTALSELRDGVPMTITLKDADGGTVLEQVFTAESFRENGTRVVIDAKELPMLNNKLVINTELSYYIHLVYNGQFTNRILESGNQSEIEDYHYTGTPFSIGPKENAMNMENVFTQFKLIPVSGKEDTFYIKAVWGEFYFSHWMDIDYWLYYKEDATSLPVDFEFTMEIQESGNIRIKNYLGDYIHVHKDSEGNINTLMHTSTGAPEGAIVGEFRLIPSTIKWEVESLATKYLEPILPSVNTSFGINSTLSNCTSGTLEQEVVFEETIQTTTTVAWEESIELTSESTSSFSATVGVSTSVSFFGQGVDVSAEATKEYSTTTGFTSSQTQYQDAQNTKSNVFSVTRSIEVQPGSAVLVYDAYQTYSNVQMPFIQRFRVRGTDTKDGIALTGEEIKSQFVFSHFNGVITKVESDFVEVTLRGTTTLDNLVDARNDAIEVANDCGG